MVLFFLSASKAAILSMSKLPIDYYRNTDTLELARDLLGKFIFTRTDTHNLCGGIITEAEAYLGANDRASHAWGNRKTQRTQTMFLPGGVAYIYLCYGIHHLFNIVTHQENVPHAILIRGVFPVMGKEVMEKRTGKKVPPYLDGPGKLTKALGIHTDYDGASLTGNTIWLEDKNLKIADSEILSGPRIGVDYAGEDAKLPYRFLIKDPSALKNIKF
jgi:DNA-3-methyladenine glycosylase